MPDQMPGTRRVFQKQTRLGHDSLFPYPSPRAENHLACPSALSTAGPGEAVFAQF